VIDGVERCGRFREKRRAYIRTYVDFMLAMPMFGKLKQKMHIGLGSGKKFYVVLACI
jgi:hypothetical protein